MKRIASICVAAIFSLFGNVKPALAQQVLDTLKKPQLDSILKNNPADTTRIKIFIELAFRMAYTRPDSAIKFGQDAYLLAAKQNDLLLTARSYNVIAIAYSNMGDYARARKFSYKALATYQRIGDTDGIAIVYNNLGSSYLAKKEYQLGLNYLYQAKEKNALYFTTAKHPTYKAKSLRSVILLNIGECYLYLNKIDSAKFFLDRSYQFAKENKLEYDDIFLDFGKLEAVKGNKQGAIANYNQAIKISRQLGDNVIYNNTYLAYANLHKQFKQRDSSEIYARKALAIADSAKLYQDVLDAATFLYGFYDEDGNLPQAYKFYKKATVTKDSLFSQYKVKQLLSIDFDEKQRQQEIVNAQADYQTKVRFYALVAGAVVLLLLMLIFWRNARHRKKANSLLQDQNEEIQKTLSELKLTQTQLIQSEKMASLGELTAGIAHEIQNPLNFVNNFSEVSIELLDEMETEFKLGNNDDAIEIAADVKLNLEKIIHHGKRADSIVKGMLQHSRSSNGQKEATDINVLADEYLRLSYHGLRAKNKGFNATMHTSYDESIDKIEMMPQDIGRVLLNLFTNAFYSVTEKKTKLGDGYEPTVWVTTKKADKGVIISIRDNGMGIPQKALDKIYQPFFTTKPTGQGTGLGLSMSYDIITKSHGGQLKVETEEGEFAEFTIKLPA